RPAPGPPRRRDRGWSGPAPARLAEAGRWHRCGPQRAGRGRCRSLAPEYRIAGTMKGKPGAKGSSSKTITPDELIEGLPEPRRSDIARLHRLIRKTVPALAPFVHGGMLGYGPYHYRYPSGREGDWFRVGLASHTSHISL